MLDYTGFAFYSQALFAPVNKSITSNEYRAFLRELRAARVRNGLTQIDVAERLKETQSFVSKCERGERRLDVIELRQYCQAIGMAMPVFVASLEQVLATPSDPATNRRKKRN